MARYPKGSVEAKIEDILNMPEPQMFSELNKIFNTARVRVQRLNKLDENRLGYRTKYRKNLIKPFLNKKGNVALNAKTMYSKTPFKLWEKAVALEKFNRSEFTSVAGAKKEAEEAAERQGLTMDQFENINRLWKFAYDRGLLDIYDPSEFEEDVQEAIDEGGTYEEMQKRLIDNLNKKFADAGLDTRINPNTYNLYRRPKPDNMGVQLRLPKVKMPHISADPDFIDETIKLGFSGTVVGWKPSKKKKG